MSSTEDIQGTDIYLIDQIMKGAFQRTHKILDAGCGVGRNMKWFATNQFSIVGCDVNSEALEEAALNTGLNRNKFKVAALENMPYKNETFDHVICNAVLHFADGEQHFFEMINGLHKVLKQHGALFIRMTSNFGLNNNYKPLGNGRYLLADESERFLLTDKVLHKLKTAYNFQQLEPVKSVLVENLRSMTTLVLLKA